MNRPLRPFLTSCFALITLLTLITCKNDPPTRGIPYDGPLQFVLDASHNSALVHNIQLYQYDDGTVSGLIPTTEHLPDHVTLTFKVPNGHQLWVGGSRYVADTLTIALNTPLHCTVIDAESNESDYRIQLFPDPGIPVFWIETEGHQPIVSKDDYINATVKVNPGTAYEQANRLIHTEIRGRGNSTWGMDKKPYRLKFHKKEPFLGFAPTKNWVLLANYSDKTLLRNYVTFEMGRQLMAAFTPRSRFVEIYLNGRYEGVYHLTDQIRVEDDRVAIDELEVDEEDEETITGGYLLEIDERLDADRWFHSDVMRFPFTFKSPEEPNDAQFAYITNYIAAVETIITDPHIAERSAEYEALIDVPSFVNFYLISELVRNNDTGGGGLSIYMHKPRGGKLAMGPLWDFDIAMGNINYNGNEAPEGWWIKTGNRWYKALFRDPKFQQAVKDRWQEVMPSLRTTIMEKIDEAAYGTLRVAQQRNFQQWDILNTWVWPNYDVFGSYEGEVNYLKTWLNTRMDWMDAEISAW
ncbi:CotH kinase family protein [Parapedobacter sp. 10938]|uniref:CotH kinase family protein n=1 Tax=Parapedobacter flavus TaxID=3110225 RepID=UPI002DBF76B2|nr:CotH kinase family protein [Parapedobacter sp. 10938]MEC3878012.1 CotH kinase family protein [Parapedobacter sp. 10938]